MKEETFKSLIPGMTEEEVTQFMNFRDGGDGENQFKTSDDFFKYLKEKISLFRNDDAEINTFKTKLDQRGVRLVTEENVFKIVVRAQVGQAVRVLEASVIAFEPKKTRQNNNTPTDPRNADSTANSQLEKSDPTGLRVTSMRIY
jgi:hypothetical protein